MIQLFWITTLTAIVIGVGIYLLKGNKKQEPKEPFISHAMGLRGIVNNRCGGIKPKDKVISISEEHFGEKATIKSVNGFSCIVEYKYNKHYTAVWQNIDSVIKI